MKVSADGLELIKSFEGLRLKAYQDQAGVWTIGYGSTRYANGVRVAKGDVLKDETEASAILERTVGTYAKAIDDRVKVPLNQNQFDALVSFAYNIGVGAFVGSTLLRLLNYGDYNSAAAQFMAWNKITDPATGKKFVQPGLTSRRSKESAHFLKQ